VRFCANSHTSKNLLAVVLALAQQTVPGTEGVDNYVVRLSSRVRGLALSHDLIADEEWKGAALGDLAARQLQPFIGEDTARVTVPCAESGQQGLLAARSSAASPSGRSHRAPTSCHRPKCGSFRACHAALDLHQAPARLLQRHARWR
jgi:hypothetical protein